MNTQEFLRHYERLADAPHAIERLRQFVLFLAVRGKLVAQDGEDEPAGQLLKRIHAEKVRLAKAGRLKEPQRSEALLHTPHDVPANWNWVSLAVAINSHSGGGTPSKSDPKYWGGDILWASVKDIGKRKYLDETIDRITDAGLAESSSNLISPNSLIVVTRMGLGKLSINRVPVAINQDLRALVLSSLVSIDYVYNFFKTHAYVGTGLTVKGIRVEELLATPLPLPPIAEQHRIVAKVDELMALCDRLEAARAAREAARDRLATASLARLNTPDPETFHDDARFALVALPVLTTRPDQIKRLRQTILNLAVRGKLVRQNANDEPAPDLLRRLQKGRLGPDAGFLSDGIQVDDLPLGWARVELSSIANVGTGLTPSRVRPEYFDPPTIPWVTSGETSESSISTTAQHISPLALRETGLRVYPPGTLLVAMYGQGKTRGQVAELKIAAATNQACAAIVLLLDDRGHCRYIKLFFEKIYEEIRALSAGGAQPNLNVGKIKSTTIPFPPLEEQHRIVAKVDELMALCDQLEASLSTSDDRRRRLLEALLHQALQPADTLAAAA